MARTKQPKELAELNGATGKNPQRYKTRGSSKSSVKVHATKPSFHNEETGWAWDSIVPAIENLKILTLQDLPTLNEMFNVYDMLVDSRKDLEDFRKNFSNKLVNMDKELVNNRKKMQDAVNNFNSTWIKYCARFGLTPSDRNNITIPESNDTDPLAVVLGE